MRQRIVTVADEAARGSVSAALVDEARFCSTYA